MSLLVSIYGPILKWNFIITFYLLILAVLHSSCLHIYALPLTITRADTGWRMLCYWIPSHPLERAGFDVRHMVLPMPKISEHLPRLMNWRTRSAWSAGKIEMNSHPSKCKTCCADHSIDLIQRVQWMLLYTTHKTSLNHCNSWLPCSCMVQDVFIK